MTLTTPRPLRSASLDALRGAAMLLMAVDHVIVYVDTDSPIRFTLTRIAMPLFFIVSGHLVRRWNWKRMLPVAAVGIVLPGIVPWIDNPNVLVWYVIGAGIIVIARRNRVMMYAIIAIALCSAANGFSTDFGSGYYDPNALFALMALGVLIPRDVFEKVPVRRWIATIGTYPLTFYITHILVIFAIGEAL